MRLKLYRDIVVIHVLNLGGMWEIPPEEIEEEGSEEPSTPPAQQAPIVLSIPTPPNGTPPHQRPKPSNPIHRSQHRTHSAPSTPRLDLSLPRAVLPPTTPTLS
nr:hypothetical protein [Chthonomonas calidirosea]